MLPPWLIERIRKQEEERRKREEQERPRVYDELHIPYDPSENPEPDDKDRGKVEIDIISPDEDEGLTVIKMLYFDPKRYYKL